MGNTQWTDDEIIFLKEHYSDMTCKDIADKLGRTRTAIHVKANKLGLKASPYHYDMDYFENIDTDDKAYWFGFLFADGYVSAEKHGYGGVVGIQLSIKDIDHLRKFNKSINGNIPIVNINKVCNINGIAYDSCCIRIYSKKMFDDLCHHGCIPNKSKNKKMPDIDDKFIWHFIRGYFDGNGCVSKGSNMNNDIYINFTSGSEVFIDELRILLFSYGVNSYIVHEKEYCFRLYIKGMKNVDRMLVFMYQNMNVCLDRKYNRAIMLYEKYNIAQRLLRHSVMSGFYYLSEKENGNPEMEIRVEGYD